VPAYDLLAIDIDGTLLDSQGRLPEAHVRSLLRAEAAGVHVVLASGRMVPSTADMAPRIGLRPGIVVGYNGGRVVDTATGEVLFHLPVPADLAAVVVARFTELGLHVNYYLDDVLYVSAVTEWGLFYHRQTGSELVPVGDLRALAGRTPTKLLVVTDIPTIDRLLPVYREEFGRVLYVTKTNPEYLEFMHPEVSKAVGVAKAAEHVGVPRGRVAAVGDGANDGPMIEWAGLGCAMGNSPAEIRAVADVVAPGNDDDGLAWFIEEFVLN
jgi:hypothetical protein